MDLTPTLLTFCYIKETFDRSGDLMLGLAPLFIPIALTFRGKQFEPIEIFDFSVRPGLRPAQPAGVAQERPLPAMLKTTRALISKSVTAVTEGQGQMLLQRPCGQIRPGWETDHDVLDARVPSSFGSFVLRNRACRSTIQYI